MAGTDKTANFSIKIGVDAKEAAKAAKELENLKSVITASKNKIDEYRIAMRAVTGSDDKAKAAKKDLQSKILAEQNTITKSNIQFRNAKATLDKYQKSTKDASKETKGFGAALGLVGGPGADAREKVSALREALSATLSPAGALGVALGVTAAVFVGFTVGLVAATYELIKFGVESANVLRNQELLREATTGSAENARNFGHQIDFLASRLPMAKEKIAETGAELAKAFVGTKVSGQGIEDTLEAMTTASAVFGDEAGRAIQGVIDRAKRFGRGGIGRFELLNTAGLKFEGVAGALAKNLHVPLQKANLLLLSGMTHADDLAKALKDASHTRFDAVNAKKMLDLDVITQKFHENLQGLYKDLKDSKGFQALLQGLKNASDLFSDTTSTGHTLKVAVTALGDAFGTVVGANGKNFNDWVRTGIGLGLRFAIMLVTAATAVLSFGQSAGGVILLKTTLYGLAGILGVIVATVVAVGVVVGAVFLTFAATIQNTITWVTKLWNFMKGISWADVGSAIVDGLTNGLWGQIGKLKTTVLNMAESIKNTFASAIGAHSPSVVFKGYGANIAQGTAAGITSGSPEAQTAVSQMVETPGAQSQAPAPTQGPSGSGGGSSGGASSGPKVVVNVDIHGGGDANEVAHFVKSDSVLEKITHAVELALKGGGIPTQTPAPAQG